MILHVMPVNDLRQHSTDSPTACPCHPETSLVEGGQIVAHNLWDKGRALREQRARTERDFDGSA